MIYWIFSKYMTYLMPFKNQYQGCVNTYPTLDTTEIRFIYQKSIVTLEILSMSFLLVRILVFLIGLILKACFKFL